MRFTRSKILTIIFLAIAIFMSIIISQSPIQAQDTATNQLINAVEEVNKHEKLWEEDFENYFRSDLSNWNKSAEVIAQELT
ncbi:MAG: hypothetical protein ACRDB1_11530, partial [Microcoleaceae cyanobacterium]